MEYTLINSDKTCGGIVGTEPTHSNWTLTPYQGGLVKEFWNGTAWVESATAEEIAESNKPIVPFEVPLWSMRTVLKQSNLFDAIIGAIQTLDEPTRSIALDYLEYGNYIERHSATVGMIQQITQLSESQVDDLFINANAIKL